MIDLCDRMRPDR